MFGIYELETLDAEIKKAIKSARESEKLWKEKRNKIEKLIGKKNMEKIGEILEM